MGGQQGQVSPTDVPRAEAFRHDRLRALLVVRLAYRHKSVSATMRAAPRYDMRRGRTSRPSYTCVCWQGFREFTAGCNFNVEGGIVCSRLCHRRTRPEHDSEVQDALTEAAVEGEACRVKALLALLEKDLRLQASRVHASPMPVVPRRVARVRGCGPISARLWPTPAQPHMTTASHCSIAYFNQFPSIALVQHRKQTKQNNTTDTCEARLLANAC